MGPRELILTDADMAQFLIVYGFLAVAPLDSHVVGRGNKGAFKDPALGKTLADTDSMLIARELVRLELDLKRVPAAKSAGAATSR